MLTRVTIPSELAKRAANFAGRLWVLDELADWAEHGTERFFLITGEPGSGKTALAAWLAGAGTAPVEPHARDRLERVRDLFQAAHFCVANQGGSVDPIGFTKAIAEQLSDRHHNYALATLRSLGVEVKVEQTIHEYWGTAIGVYIGTLNANPNPLDAYQRLLRDPLEELSATESSLRVFVLVDALDEALASGTPNIVTLLAASNDFPAGVRFVLTGRNDPRIVNQFTSEPGHSARSRRLNLSDLARAHEADGDIRSYVDQRLDEELREQLERIPDPESHRNALVSSAAGNFLYIKFLLDEVAARKRSLADLAGLPADLFGLYREYLGRLMPEMLRPGASRGMWMDRLQPLLGTLSVAAAPVSRGLLEHWLGSHDGTIGSLMNDLIQIVEEDSVGCRLYHRSMAEFLNTSELSEGNTITSNLYYTAPRPQHERIARYYLDRFQNNWKACDSYGLAHLATHLHGLRDNEEYRKSLYSLLSKPFMEAKLDRFGSHQSFAADVGLVIEAAASGDPGQLVHLVRSCLIYATLRSVATKIPLDVLSALVYVDQAAKARAFAELLPDWEQRCHAYGLIGQAFLQRGDCVSALEALQHATELAGGNERLHIVARRSLAQALIGLQRLDEARAVATQLDDFSRDEMYGALVSAFAQDQQFDRACVLTQSMKPGTERTEALVAIALALTRANHLDDAVELAKRVGEDPHRVLTQAVHKAIELGELESALLVARRFEPVQRHYTLTELAKAAVRAGKLDLARRASEEIALSERAPVQAAIARALAATAQFTDALAEAEAIDAPYERTDTLAEVLSSLADVQGREAAFAAAQRLGHPDEKPEMLRVFAAARAKLGNVEDTIAIAALIDPGDIRSRVLTEAAQALILAGNYDGARCCAEKIEDNYTKERMFETLIRALGGAEKTDQAVLVARQITDDSSRDRILDQAAVALARTAKFNVALRLAAAVGAAYCRGNTLGRVMCYLVEAGGIDQALTVIEPFWQELDKDTVLAEAARELARAGQFGPALAIAEKIKLEWSKEPVLSDVVGTMVETRAFDLATATARQLESKARQAEAFGRLSLAMALADDPNAGETTNEASALAADLKEADDQFSTLSRLALAFARIGQRAKTADCLRRAFAAMEQSTSTWQKREPLHLLAQAQMAMGDLEQARSTALVIDDRSQGASVLCEVAEACVRAGDRARTLELLHEAIAVARETDDYTKLKITREAVRILPEAGDLDQAIALATAVPHDYTQSDLLRSLLPILFRTADFDRVDRALAAMRDPEAKAESLGDYACNLAELGSADKAIQKAREIADPRRFDDTLGAVAQRLIPLNQIDRAEECLEAIQDPFAKTKTREEMAQSLARAGSLGRALKIVTPIEEEYRKECALSQLLETAAALVGLQKALAEYRSRLNDSEFALVLRNAGRVWLTAGKLDDVPAIANQMSDLSDRDSLTRELALGLTNAGRFDEAIQQAETITVEYLRPQVLGQVLQEIATRNGAADAWEMAKRFRNSDRPQALEQTARGLSETGKPDQAVFLAEKIDEQDRKVQALSEIACRLARAKQSDAALDVAAKIEHEWSRVYNQRLIAVTLAEVGELPAALEIIERLPDSWQKAQCFVELAKTLAGLGKFDDAVAVADKLSGDDSKRATALSHLAEELVRAGQPDRAKSLLTDVLARAEAIDDRGAKEGAFHELALALLQSQSALAFQLAKAIPDQHWHKADLLGRLAWSIGSQDAARAAATVREALEAGRHIQKIEDRVWMLGQLAARFVELNGESSLQEFVEVACAGASDVRSKVDVLAQIARVLANWSEQAPASSHGRRGRIFQFFRRWRAQRRATQVACRAWEAAESLGSANQAEMLSRISLAFIRAGRRRRARQCARQAYSAALSLPETVDKVVALEWVTAPLVQLDPAQAVHCLDHIFKLLTAKPDREKANTLSSVLERLLAVGTPQHHQRARDTLDGLSSELDKIRVLQNWARAQAEAGNQAAAAQDARRAVSLAGSVADDAARIDALNLAIDAVSYARDGQALDQALQLIEAVQDDGQKARILARAADRLAQTGSRRTASVAKRARELIASVPDPSEQAYLLSLVTRTYAAINDTPRAILEFQAALKVARLAGRESLFNTLGTGGVCLAALDQGEWLAQVCRAVLDVEGWWGF